MKNPFADVKNPITTERVIAVKNAAFKTAAATMKYGTVFVSGVCVGTVCGVVLFFHISEK